MKNRVYVVIPNWNGAAELPAAITSVLAQSYTNLRLIVVDNGSSDNSRAIIESFQAKDPRLITIYRDKNYGYTGGINPGMELAIKDGAGYVATFNTDAVADKDWLRYLVAFLEEQPTFAVAACKLLHSDGKTFDSTGDQFSIWGLPYPRGRDEPASTKYDKLTTIFGASGGASLFRVTALKEVGIFDQDFFAYYEDIDLSFRMQFAGWKVGYVPEARVYHEQGTTSAKMKDFTIYQSFKNFPMVMVKDIPKGLRHIIWPRFIVAYGAFFASAVRRGKGWPALKGFGVFLRLLPKKLMQRRVIQSTKKVDANYINSLLLHDIPPDQRKLLQLRKLWWKVRGKKV